jgi:RNA polymerase sigma factor (TIGR02999 family)
MEHASPAQRRRPVSRARRGHVRGLQGCVPGDPPRAARHRRELFTGERAGHTLQATALVNEACLRLRSCGDATASDPQRFRRAAALAMRRVLIEHARGRQRVKRGERRLPAALDSVELASAGEFEQVLEIDDAIERLAREAPEVAELVRLRFDAGLDVRAAAEALGVSERSAQRDWSFARARLFQLHSGGA